MASYLNALGLNCALGQGKQAVATALFAGDSSGMQAQSGWVAERALTVGVVPGDLPQLPDLPGHPPSRNNQLLLAAALEIEPELRAAIARFGAERIAVVLGTSTSGIEEASQSIAHYLEQGELPAHYTQRMLAMEATVRELLVAAQAERKVMLDAGRVDTVFKVGDRVLLRTKELLDAAEIQVGKL